ncbi:flocculation protein FLO11-like, partial [Empidonax traillii]|uniref:flocculation protein FLO11-like n=1 Tax=Empidonax traillii TaxID=164674 RepID=UPI000FFD7DF0
SPSEGSKAVLDIPKPISPEILSETEPVIPSEQQVMEQGDQEQSRAAEMQGTPTGTESPVPAPQSPSEGSQSLLDTDQQIPTETPSKAEPVIQGSSQELMEQGDQEQTRAAEMQITPTGTESPVPAPQSPSEGSQAVLDMAELITTDILRKAELEMQGSSQELEEQGDLEQSTAAVLETVPAEESRESLVSAPHSPCSTASPLASSLEVLVASEQQEDTEGRSVLSLLSVQETEEGTSAGEEEWKSFPEQGEEVREPELSPWEEDIPSNLSEEALGPGKQENPQAVAQEGPSSASSVGTQVAAEAARELPSPAPAPLTPTEAEPAAAAPAGAAEEEEPQGPLAPEEPKAEGSAASGELVPSAGTQSPVPAPQSPSEGSQALLDTDQSSSSEFLSKAKLKIQGSGRERVEQGDLEESTDTETGTAITADGEGSPVPAPQSPSEGSQTLLNMAELITNEILSQAEVDIQGSEQQMMEQGDLEESTDTETATAITADGEGSPVPAPQSPCSPPSSSAASLEGQALREQQEEAERGSFLLKFAAYGRYG